MSCHEAIGCRNPATMPSSTYFGQPSPHTVYVSLLKLPCHSELPVTSRHNGCPLILSPDRSYPRSHPSVKFGFPLFIVKNRLQICKTFFLQGQSQNLVYQ